MRILLLRSIRTCDNLFGVAQINPAAAAVDERIAAVEDAPAQADRRNDRVQPDSPFCLIH